MRQSFLKVAQLAKQTDTELVIYNRQMIETLKGKAIDTYIKNLPPTKISVKIIFMIKLEIADNLPSLRL